MGTVKFNDGNFYLNGEYIGSGKFISATETVRQRYDRVKFLEEELIHERARNKELCSVLNEFKAYFDTPQELSNFIANASKKNAELKVAMEKLKQEAITIDMVEKAAYDVIRSIIKDNDISRSTLWATRSDEALVALAASRMIERIKQYAKEC